MKYRLTACIEHSTELKIHVLCEYSLYCGEVHGKFIRNIKANSKQVTHSEGLLKKIRMDNDLIHRFSYLIVRL